MRLGREQNTNHNIRLNITESNSLSFGEGWGEATANYKSKTKALT